MKTEFNAKWSIPLGLLLVASLFGAFWPTAVPVVVGGTIVAGDVAWMLAASALVMIMTPGLAFFYGGMVRQQNVVSTMLQSIIALGVVSVLWVVVGFSLAFGDSMGGVIGNPTTFFMFHHVGGATHPALSPTIPLALFAMFQLKFAIITPALITGSFAERVRFSSYLLFICLFSILIYAPLAHWTWHPDGFLRKWGVLDFAGGTVVHMSAGFAALAGALALGRRKVHIDSEAHSPYSLPYVIIGTGLLWFGWFGFNAGSAGAANESAAMAFATTNTAAAAAAMAWGFFDAIRGRKVSAVGVCIGGVVGLVAITPASGYVSIGASLFIGAFSAIISNLAVGLKSRSALDDTLDVFPCHGVGGLFGMLATAVFAQNGGLITGNTTLFFTHIKGMVLICGFTFAGAFVLYKITNVLIPLRVTAEQEALGLDVTQHGESTVDDSTIMDKVRALLSEE